MRRVHWFGLAMGLAVVACEGGSGPVGDGGETQVGSDGGADGATSGDPDGSDGPGGDAGLDEIEAACEADCDAQFATECAPPGQNVLTCKLSCAVATVQLGDFCLEEYTATVQCRADGGYDCLMGYPYPRSTCAVAQAGLAECSADLGCKRYCDDAVEAGCGGDSFDGCLDACLADKAAAPGYCGIYLDSWRLCEAQFGIECGGDGPLAAAECTHGLGGFAECLADETDDPCTGYCYVADELACGSDCAASCATRLADPTCGQDFASLVDCELRHGDFACTDGVLLGVGTCDYETSDYQACLAGG